MLLLKSCYSESFLYDIIFYLKANKCEHKIIDNIDKIVSKFHLKDNNFLYKIIKHEGKIKEE